MDEGHRAEMKPPAAGPAEGAAAEAALTELREVNERLLLSGLREQQRAAEAGRLADALEHQALHDGLTGLPTRALFYDRLRQAVLTAQRERGTLALLFISAMTFLTVADFAQNGVTGLGVVGAIVVAIVGIGVIGAFMAPPRG